MWLSRQEFFSGISTEQNKIMLCIGEMSYWIIVEVGLLLLENLQKLGGFFKAFQKAENDPFKFRKHQ